MCNEYDTQTREASSQHVLSWVPGKLVQSECLSNTCLNASACGVGVSVVTNLRYIDFKLLKDSLIAFLNSLPTSAEVTVW